MKTVIYLLGLVFALSSCELLVPGEVVVDDDLTIEFIQDTLVVPAEGGVVVFESEKANWRLERTFKIYERVIPGEGEFTDCYVYDKSLDKNFPYIINGSDYYGVGTFYHINFFEELTYTLRHLTFDMGRVSFVSETELEAELVANESDFDRKFEFTAYNGSERKNFVLIQKPANVELGEYYVPIRVLKTTHKTFIEGAEIYLCDHHILPEENLLWYLPILDKVKGGSDLGLSFFKVENNVPYIEFRYRAEGGTGVVAGDTHIVFPLQVQTYDISRSSPQVLNRLIDRGLLKMDKLEENLLEPNLLYLINEDDEIIANIVDLEFLFLEEYIDAIKEGEYSQE